MAVGILEGADQQAAIASPSNEHLSVAGLAAALGLKQASGIPKVEAEPLVDIGDPVPRSLAAICRQRQGATGEKYRNSCTAASIVCSALTPAEADSSPAASVLLDDPGAAFGIALRRPGHQLDQYLDLAGRQGTEQAEAEQLAHLPVVRPRREAQTASQTSPQAAERSMACSTRSSVKVSFNSPMSTAVGLHPPAQHSEVRDSSTMHSAPSLRLARLSADFCNKICQDLLGPANGLAPPDAPCHAIGRRIVRSPSGVSPLQFQTWPPTKTAALRWRVDIKQSARFGSRGEDFSVGGPPVLAPTDLGSAADFSRCANRRQLYGHKWTCRRALPFGARNRPGTCAAETLPTAGKLCPAALIIHSNSGTRPRASYCGHSRGFAVCQFRCFLSRRSRGSLRQLRQYPQAMGRCHGHVATNP